ncbi:hypothetical protein MRX96_049252 [Rhipicephalus microplus]
MTCRLVTEGEGIPASSARNDNNSRAINDKSYATDDAETIIAGMDNVYALLKKAGNLLVYKPQLVSLAELDHCGLSSEVLIRELNRDGGAASGSKERIEVANSMILPFLAKVFSLKNVKPYLAWEFLRHSRACVTSPRFQEMTLADSCFDCVERVAGLAAHVPFLRISSDVDSQARVSVFLTHLKNFVVTTLSEAKWLSPMQKELMIERLFKFEFTRGVPATKNAMALLNDHYAYLPVTTGHFAHDFDEAAHAAWNATLRRTSGLSFPLLSSFPNILTARGSAYIPAVALVPPLYSYGESDHVNFGFLGVALIRSMVHDVGFTGLQKLPQSENGNTAAEHLDLLGRCLRLNQSSKQAYASEMADAFALDVAVRAFLEGRQEKRAPQKHIVFTDICTLTCTHEDPRRCDTATKQTYEFEAAFTCPHTSAMTKATKCNLW